MNRESGSTPGGFTLIEMMVTLAVGGILLALAVPSFVRFIQDSRRSDVVNELVNSFQLARSEAVRRGQQVGVCASSDGSSCASTSTAWTNGWIVFVNSNADASPDRANTEELLRAYANPNTTVTISSTSDDSGVLSGFTDGRFRFRSFSQTAAEGELIVCDSRGSSEARKIEVTASGTVRVAENSITCP